MRTLLATTAIAIAIGVPSLAFASATFVESESTYEIELTLQAETPMFLESVTEVFYRGDFMSESRDKLSVLTTHDLYTGMGAAAMSTVRNVT